MNSFKRHIYRQNRIITEQTSGPDINNIYNINPTGIASLSNFCKVNANLVVYMDEAFNSNTLLATVYQDTDTSIPFNGNGDYYAMTKPRQTGLTQGRTIIVTGNYIFGKIDSQGIITDYIESSILNCTDSIVFEQTQFTQNPNTNQDAIDDTEERTYYINPLAFTSSGSILNNAQVYKDATLTTLYTPGGNYEGSGQADRMWVSCQTVQGGSLRFFSIKLNPSGVVIGYSL